MKSHYYIEVDGRPVATDARTREQWLKANFDKRRVALTEIGPGLEVSTVFLGLDYSLSPAGPPLVYETMTFHNNSGGECRRYSTREEAIAGHEAVVEGLKADSLTVRLSGTDATSPEENDQ